MTNEELDNIIDLIEDLPTFPGEMPDDIYERFRNADKEQLENYIRMITRLTKNEIIEKLTVARMVLNAEEQKKEDDHY